MVATIRAVCAYHSCDRMRDYAIQFWFAAITSLDSSILHIALYYTRTIAGTTEWKKNAIEYWKLEYSRSIVLFFALAVHETYWNGIFHCHELNNPQIESYAWLNQTNFDIDIESLTQLTLWRLFNYQKIFVSNRFSCSWWLFVHNE